MISSIEVGTLAVDGWAVKRGGDWAGPQPAQSPPRCIKFNSAPINGQCSNHRIAVGLNGALLCGVNEPIEG